MSAVPKQEVADLLDRSTRWVGGSAAGGVSGAVNAAGLAIAAKPTVHIVVNGPIIGPSGIDELAGMLNDAVQGRDVRLIATQVKQSGRVTR